MHRIECLHVILITISLELNGSFSIDYFIGPEGGAITVPPQDYSLAPTLAGTTYIFSSPIEICENCQIQQEHGHLVSDTTPITPILMDYIKIGHLASLDPDHVKPFLTDRLRWRVQTVSQTSSNLSSSKPLAETRLFSQRPTAKS